jgi:signal transduction histidine kinase
MAQAERSELGQTAGLIAHDLNNALTGILGRAQLALGQSRDEKITRHLRLIEQSALDAAQVVLKLQEFACSLRDATPANDKSKKK